MDNRTNTDKKRKRYRVRYDRIFALVLMLVVLTVLIASCAKGCSSDDDTSDSGVTPPQTSEPVSDDSAALSSEPTTTDVSQTEVPTTTADPALAGFNNIEVEYNQVNNGDLVLINTVYQYKFQQDDINLVPIFENINDCYTVRDNILQLDSNALTQLNALMQAFYDHTEINNLRIINGYRTFDEQNEKHQQALAKIPGGCSDFHSGRLVEIAVFPKDGDSYFYSPKDDYAWFNDLAPYYGFTLRFPEGKEEITGDESRGYAYRYVGIPHAVYMTENNLCMEEYIELLKNYTNLSPLKVQVNESEYDVYYVPAALGGSTQVPVPNDRQYTISGNNVDGFIVTAQNY